MSDLLLFLLGFSIPIILVVGFIWLISRPKKGEEKAESTSTFVYRSPDEMLEHARSIAEAPLPSQTSKPASVTGRAIVGGILGGTPGAIIGAASAIDKNNRSK